MAVLAHGHDRAQEGQVDEEPSRDLFGAIFGVLLPIYFVPDLVIWLPQRMRCSSTPRKASKSTQGISPMAYVAMY